MQLKIWNLATALINFIIV